MYGPSIANLPPLSDRPNDHYASFTILRDPIERLVSQFFFVGPGERFVKSTNLKMCRSSESPQTSVRLQTSQSSPKCAGCLRQSTEVALLELQNNEQLWLGWLQESAAYGFGERYMPNYYVYKLTAGANPSSRRAKDRNLALRCFAGNALECSTQSIDVLSNIALAEYFNNTGRDLKESLALAKQFLRDQFHFLILDLMKTEKEATLN